MARLETLLIGMEIETAKLRQGLDSARGMVQGFSGQVGKLGESMRSLSENAAVEMGREIVKSLSEFVFKGAEAADQMRRLAQSAGVSVESFSRLAYAGKLSHVSTEDLSIAFNHLNKNLALAGAGGRDQAAIFSALGVAVKDSSGHLRSSDAVMKDLADRFAGMKDGASKSALAIEVFGKSGAQLLPFLNEGSAGLAKMGAESDRLGFTIGTTAAESAKKFVEDIDRLGAVSTAVATQVAANVAPAFGKLTDDLLSSKEGADFLKGAVVGLTVVMKALATGGVIIATLFDKVGKTLGAAASIVVNVISGDFSAALDDFNQLGHQMAEDTQGAVNKIKSIWADGPGEEAKKDAEKVKVSGDKVLAAIEAQKKATAAYAEAWKGLSKVLDEYKAKAAGFGLGPLGELEARLQTGDLSKELKNIGGAGVKMAADIRAAADAMEELKLVKLGDQLSFEALRSGNAVAAKQQDQKTDLANIFASPAEVFAKATAGLSDFYGALKVAAEQTSLQTDLLSSAKVLEEEADRAAALAMREATGSAEDIAKAGHEAAAASLEAARGLTLEADAAGRAAGKANSAADAFRDAAKKLEDAAKEAARGMLNSAMHIVNATGDLGQVVQSAVQGFQSGGLWGAIIAIIAEVLVRLKSFKEVLSVTGDMFEQSIGNINRDLKEFFGATAQLGKSIMRFADAIEGVIGAIIKPLFDLLGDWLSKLVDTFEPVIEVVSALASVLAPILKLFGDIGKVLVPLAPIFAVIGFILKLVALVILAIMNAIGTIINAIAKAFGATTDVVDTTTMQKEMTDIATHLGDSFDPNKGKSTLDVGGTGTMPGTTGGAAPTGNPNAMVTAISFEAFKQANTGGDTSWAAYQKYLESLPGYIKPVNSGLAEAAKNLQKFNEAFTNAPSGYKLAEARFNATRGVGGGMGQANDPRGVQMNGVTIIVQATKGMSADELLDLMRKGSERAAFRANGSTQRWDPSHP